MPRIARRLLPLYLVFLVLAALWPLSWRSCIICTNGAAVRLQTLPDSAPKGSITFAAPGLVEDRSGGALLHDALTATGHLTVIVRAQSATIDQTGPARIVSISPDPLQRNLTLGQEGDELVLRLRTPQTGLNGAAPAFSASGAIDPGNAQLFAATYDGTTVRLFVDGQIVLDRQIAAGDFGGWDRTFPLVFGNEATGDRPWRGVLHDVVVYAEVLPPDAIAALHPGALTITNARPIYHLAARCLTMPPQGPDQTRFGTCARPHTFRNAGIAPMLGREARWASDYIKNFLIYLPFGILLVMTASDGLRGAALVAAGIVLPLLLEMAQSLIDGRTSSLIDLLSAWVGLGLGVVLARRRYRAGSP